MARKGKNTVDYFPHLIKQGKTMFYLRSKYNNDGYAVWYMLLEKLGEAEYHYLDLSNDVQIMYLASEFKVSEIMLNEIINILVKFGEFDTELWECENILFNEKFIDNIQDAYKRRNNDCITRENLILQLNLKSIHKPQNVVHKSEKRIHKPDLCSDNVDINTHTILDKNIVDNIRQDNTIKEEIKKENNTHIPTKEKFLLFAKESCARAGKDYESLKFTIEAKYDSWVEDCWFDGMGNKINNWQTKFNSTLPYLKEIKNKEKGAGRYDVGEQDYTKNEGFEVM